LKVSDDIHFYIALREESLHSDDIACETTRSFIIIFHFQVQNGKTTVSELSGSKQHKTELHFTLIQWADLS
jgi:hypothetical protein